MMKVLYIIIMVLCIIFLMVVYFTNIMYLWTQPLYLWSNKSTVPAAVWLLLLILAAFILWFSTFWLLKNIVKGKTKDFDEYDL